MTPDRGWTVRIEVAGHEPSEAVDFEDQVASLADALDRYSAVVSMRADRAGYGTTLSLDGPLDASGAVDAALRIFLEHALAAELPDWPVVRVEALTFSVHAEVGARKTPELVGVAEIARYLGITRQRATKLTRQPGFPDPIAALASGSVWTRVSLERFQEEWTRKPGRKQWPPGRDEPEVLKLREHVIELTNRLHHASDPVEAGIIAAELRAITAKLRALTETGSSTRRARRVERVPNPKVITVDPVWPGVESEHDDA